MGKTNPTDRSVIDYLAKNEWESYRRTLRRRNQPLYDNPLKKSRRHADAANEANPRSMDGALFSMLLAQQREIVDLQEKLSETREELCQSFCREYDSLVESRLSRPGAQHLYRPKCLMIVREYYDNHDNRGSGNREGALRIVGRNEYRSYPGRYGPRCEITHAQWLRRRRDVPRVR